MKKILIILWCVCLCGCSSQTTTKQKEVVKKNEISTIEPLIMKEWKYLLWNGDGNDEGYYRIKQRELDTGDTISNLRYFDYKTKQEVYLCDKPECLHIDETCTSYLPFLSISSALFVYQNHLYLTSYKIGELGSNMNGGAVLYQIDLDGKNRKAIWEIGEGENFDISNILIGGNKLYIPIEKEALYEVAQNSTMSVVKEKKLMALDLKTKKTEEIIDLKNKVIMGVYNNELVISQTHYQDDPDKYIENKDYEGYDRAVKNYTIGYCKYDLRTSIQSQKIQTPDGEDDRGVYYQNKIYWITSDKLNSLDLEDGNYQELLSLENSGYSIANIIDNYLIADLWDNDEYSNSILISLDNLEIKPLQLYKSALKEPIDILNICQDYFLVRYDYEGAVEKTWAGTDQFEITKDYFGLISKEDYWNSRTNYQKLIEIE